MKLKGSDFPAMLRAAQSTAVHLEMRDSYAVASEAEEFEAWRQGKRYDPADRASWWRPWLDLITETVDRGVVIRRARVVSEPVSEYIRYEHSGTFSNVAAGEQVRWLPRRRALDIAFPGADFWLFDGRVALFNIFTGEGDWADPCFELVEAPATARLCASAFEAVWERGIPHDQFHV
ncbi:DUF6879 family protein [Streptacidiphilus cavernicola]|uniref:DUF6879 family protein n=1 Tax=Streptacidiphilus cavernicola TaxID=3342716 RepID=A0ABV6W4S6_9ACTN